MRATNPAAEICQGEPRGLSGPPTRTGAIGSAAATPALRSRLLRPPVFQRPVLRSRRGGLEHPGARMHGPRSGQFREGLPRLRSSRSPRALPGLQPARSSPRARACRRGGRRLRSRAAELREPVRPGSAARPQRQLSLSAVCSRRLTLPYHPDHPGLGDSDIDGSLSVLRRTGQQEERLSGPKFGALSLTKVSEGAGIRTARPPMLQDRVQSLAPYGNWRTYRSAR